MTPTTMAHTDTSPSDAVCLADAPVAPASGETRQPTPCERLVFGILTQAIRDYLEGRPSVRMDAERWFLTRRRHFGEYLWCCDILKLDPDYLWARRADWKLIQQQNGIRTMVVALRAAA